MIENEVERQRNMKWKLACYEGLRILLSGSLQTLNPKFENLP